MSTQQNSKFNAEQYAMILNFLEDPKNNAKVFGVSGKTEVGVAPPRKIEAWKELATIINSRFKGKYNLDHKSMADRWRTYMKKYFTAREKSNSTGFGVTDEDKKKNIHTVQAKLDMLCPHYERMHALVGRRANVTPAAAFDSGNISSGTDLNEVLRFKTEDVYDFLDDDDALTPIKDSSEPQVTAADANGNHVIANPIVLNNEEVDLSPPFEHNLTLTWPKPEDDSIFPNDLDTSQMLAGGSKRHMKVDNSAYKKFKKDRRKELPSLSGTKNPTQTRNLLAKTIQESSSAKAITLAAIKEQKLKFEEVKWETEREDREMRRREEREEYERKRNEEREEYERKRNEEREEYARKRIKDEQRRKEDMEEEKRRRAEDKAEKNRERRFALLQTLLANGKSADEIQDILAMLLQ